MSTYDSHQIFKQCENKHYSNLNEYKQKNSNGYDCCFKPNVITFEKVNKYNLVNSTDQINLNTFINDVTQYLFYYQLLNMENFPIYSSNSKVVGSGIGSSTNGCKFFADYNGDNNHLFKDIIPSSIFNMQQGTSSSLGDHDSVIQNNFHDLYIYVKHSQHPLLKFITNDSGVSVNLPNFNSINKITCNNTNETVKYIRYEEYKKSDYYEYLPVCIPSTTNKISLEKTEISYNLFNFMDDIGKVCTTNECNTIEYPSISGSYIGNPLGSTDLNTFTNIEIIGLAVIGLIVLFFMIFLMVKINNSKIKEKDQTIELENLSADNK